jgi:hypothetical protein
MDSFVAGQHKVFSFYGSNLCSDTKIESFRTIGDNIIVSKFNHPLEHGMIVIENVAGQLNGRLTGTRGLIEPAVAYLVREEDGLRVRFIVSQPGGENCRLGFSLRRIFTETKSVSSSATSSQAVTDEEILFWQSVENSGDVDMYRAYLNSYPTGRYVPLAQLKIKQINRKRPNTTSNDERSAVEIEFWKNIKDSNDPTMFTLYLEKYPSGAFSLLAKIKLKKLTVSPTTQISDPFVWCATPFTVERIYESWCRSKQGKPYPAVAGSVEPPREALWEHLRLKAKHKKQEEASFTASDPSSALTQYCCGTDQVTKETVFWESHLACSNYANLMIRTLEQVNKLKRPDYKNKICSSVLSGSASDD